MAAYPLGKQTAGRHRPHDWLMSLAMDFAACVICGGEDGTNGSHLVGFSEDVSFTCHSVATRPLPTGPPTLSVGVLLVLATPVKTGWKFS